MGNKASFPVVSLPKDRVVIVTGANSGIGYEIAKWLAMMGASVILACRSEERAKKAMEKMQEEFEIEKSNGNKEVHGSTLAIEFMKVDLASFESVQHFCEEFKKSGRPLHVLVCNAAVTSIPYTESEDGFETILQVNYLSHFLISTKLLSTMKLSGSDCRIIFVSSRSEKYARFRIEAINNTALRENYRPYVCYGRSKLFQVMQMFAMSRYLSGSDITVNCLHPGIVETGIWRHSYSWFTKCIHFLAQCFCVIRTPIHGATCAIDLAVNPKHVGVSGHFWMDCKIIQTSQTSRDEGKQDILWKSSLDAVKEFLSEEEINEVDRKWCD